MQANGVFLAKEEDFQLFGLTHWVQVLFNCINGDVAKKLAQHFKEYFESTCIPEITEIHYLDAENVFVLALGNYMQD